MLSNTLIPIATKQKIHKPVPAEETPPLSLTAPHLLPFSPLSPEEGTSWKRLGKPFDFILLHPLNGQKTKENRCRRQYFQLATKSSTQMPSLPSNTVIPSPSLWDIFKRKPHTKAAGFVKVFVCFVFVFNAELRNRKWKLYS